MGNRIFVGVVVLLWGASMTWLVTTKIMPAFVRGEAPPTGTPAIEPVGWKISTDTGQLGTAAYQVVPGAEGTQEIHSRVRLENVSLSQMAPRWMAQVVKPIGALDVDTRTRTVLDPLGNLSSFETGISLNGDVNAVKITGKQEDGRLKLRVQYAATVQELDHPWSQEGPITSDLTPEPKLLGVSVGQTWQKEFYNPLGGGFELLQATVLRDEPMFVDGKLSNTRLIEYRAISDAGVVKSDRSRARQWVADDGTVVRQEVQLFNARLRFDRLDEVETNRFAEDFLQIDRVATLTTPTDLPATGEGSTKSP